MRLTRELLPIGLGLCILLPLSSAAQGYGARSSASVNWGAPHWGYHGEHGPAHWADLSRQYGVCKTGQRQSPIDIHGVRPERLPNLSFQYRTSSLTVADNGHTIKVDYEPGSYLRIGPKRYELKQFHFHTPSEHTVNGVRADMEIQLVHEDAAGNIVVVAVPVHAGRRRNAILERLWEHAPKQAGRSAYRRHVGINPIFLLPSKRAYYSYIGSLTTPPCTEGVRWIVLQQPLEVSAQQVRRFRQLMGENNRPVQPMKAAAVVSSHR